MEKKTGFTKSAELLNLRLATVGFTIAVLTELITGVGPVNQVLSVFGLHL